MSTTKNIGNGILYAHLSKKEKDDVEPSPLYMVIKTVPLHILTKKLLNELKECEYQTYDSVIRGLIRDSKELKALKEKEQKKSKSKKVA